MTFLFWMNMIKKFKYKNGYLILAQFGKERLLHKLVGSLLFYMKNVYLLLVLSTIKIFRHTQLGHQADPKGLRFLKFSDYYLKSHDF